jgi:hypothetical protein
MMVPKLRPNASSRIYWTGLAAAAVVFAFSAKIMHRAFRSDTYWDDVCFALITATVVVGFMYQRELKRRDIERRELEAFRATMVTVQDIVGNFLNSMQLVTIEGEGLLPPATLRLVEHSISDAQAQLTALANLKRFQKTPTAIGAGVDYPAPALKPPVDNCVHH